MSSNIRIVSGPVLSPDRRENSDNGITTFDDDPANTDGASNPSVITPEEVALALRGTNGADGTSVLISTQSANESEAGDMTFSSPLTYGNTVARSLTLNAAGNILLNADIAPSVLGAALNLSFNAGSSAANPNNPSPNTDNGNPAGHIEMGAGVTIDSNGGTISFTGGLSASAHALQGTIKSRGGTITVDRSISNAGSSLVLDARGSTDGVVSISGGIQTNELGVAASSFSAGSISTSTIAMALSGANNGVNLVNSSSLTVGTVGSVSGITTNTGNVSLRTLSGGLTILNEIDAVGQAPSTINGINSQTGWVSLIASTGSVTVAGPVTGRGTNPLTMDNANIRGVTITAGSGTATIDGKITALAAGSGAVNGIFISGSLGIVLGADLQSDGTGITLSTPTGGTTLTADTVTIDTDQSAGGNAGSVSIGGVNSDGLGSRTLIIDARETAGGTGGSVTLGGIGGGSRVEALGIGGASAATNGTNNVGTLAIALTGANQSIGFSNNGSLTIGDVGPFSGIKTNAGNVTITTTNLGTLTVESAINAIGTATPVNFPTNQQGSVSLTSAGNLTVDDTITGRGRDGTAGVFLNAQNNGAGTGVVTINADITALENVSGGAGGISVSAQNGITLGADLQSDGGTIALNNVTTLKAGSFTIDTDQSATGNAGNVSISSVNGPQTGSATLIVDARATETGTDGSVNLGSIGSTTRVEALGVGAASLSNATTNNVGTLAVALSAANRGIYGATQNNFFVSTGGLTIGDVGPFSGITTNSGDVKIAVNGGNITVAKAINTIGAAAPGDASVGLGYQSGVVALLAQASNLTVDAAITGRGHDGNVGVSLVSGGTTAINAKITALAGVNNNSQPGISISGTTGILLGADLQTDGNNASLGTSTPFTNLTTSTVTIDTDQTAEGNAGAVTFLSAVNSDMVAARTLIIDARETGSGSGLGGAVQFSGAVGAGTRLAGLGVGGNSLSLANTTHNVGTLAVALTGANQGFGLSNSGALTVGSVGPFSGITTNTGNVAITTQNGGNLTIVNAINAIGTADSAVVNFTNQSGSVFLTAAGNLTVESASPITGRGHDSVSGVLLRSQSGTVTVNSKITALAGVNNPTANGILIDSVSEVRLGADLQSDGNGISVDNTTLTAPTVTIDTDQSADGNAGNVTFGTVNGDGLGSRTLIVDARETEGGSGTGGTVSFGRIGGTVRLDALGVGAGRASFFSDVNNPNNVGTLAVEQTNANHGFSFFNSGQLTIGSVGPFNGIKTNNGDVRVETTAGNLTISKAIDTTGTGPGNNGFGFQSGYVWLVSAGNLTINDTITGGAHDGGIGVLITVQGMATINADITARQAVINPGTIGGTGGITINGTSGVILRADLQTDSGNVFVNSSNGAAVTLGAGTFTIDTDLTAGGEVGIVNIGAMSGQAGGTSTLIIDARETFGGSSADGGVTLGVLGANGRVGGLGVGAGRVQFNTGTPNNLNTLAVTTSNANQGFTYIGTGSLTIGTVGAFSGITTNSGVVTVNMTSGDLTVAKAINTAGPAPGGDAGLGFQNGRISLTANAGNVTVSAPITGRSDASSGTNGITITATNGIATIAGKVTDAGKGANGISITGTNGIALAADLQTDGASVTLNTSNQTTLTGDATIDTDQTVGGNAGNVNLGNVKSQIAGTKTLVIDARESNGGLGSDGTVNLSQGIGGNGRVGALGVGASTVTFSTANGANDVGTLALALSNQSNGVTYTNVGALKVGTVGPISGITTNTKNVSLTVASGALTVEQKIDTVSGVAASGGQTGAIDLRATNGVTLSGANAAINTASSFTVDADTDQNGGVYTQGGGTSVSAGSVSITASNVALSGSITATGDVTFVPSPGVTTIGVASAGGFELSDAELDNVSAGGTITIGSANVSSITLASTTALSQGAKNLQFTTGPSGTITIGNNNVSTTGTVGLTTGSISGGAGVVAASTINASTATGMAFKTSADTLRVTNTASGDIVVTSTGATNVAGSNVGIGAFTVTASGALTAGGAINAGVIHLTGASLALANAVTSSGLLDLKATNGTITQIAAITGGTLTGSSTGATTLDNGNNALTAIDPFSANGLTLVNAGALAINGAVNAGTGAAAITAGGNLTVSGTVDGTGVTLTAPSGAIKLGANVNAHTGAANLNGPVDLTAASSVSGSSVAFSNRVDGAFALTVSTTGTATFGGAVGGSTALASLNVTGATVALGGNVTTTGTQNYTGAVSLGAHTVLIGTNGVFNAPITGNNFNLALNFSDASTIAGANLSGVHDLSVGNGGGTTISGTISTSGTQTYTDALTLSGNTTAMSSGPAADGAITFAAIDAAFAGVQSLTVNSAGTTTFGGAVGANAALASLTTDAAGSTLIGGNVTTSGAQTYNDAVVLGAAATLASTTFGAVTFGGTLNGPHALTVNTGGSTVFAGAIGDQTALVSMTTNAGGSTAINGGYVRTSGDQHYGDAISFGGATTVISASGTVAFDNTVALGGTLTLQATGNATFAGGISGSGGLIQNGGGTTRLLSTNTYTGATIVNGGTLDVDGSIAAASPVTVNSGATLSGDGAVGAVSVASGGTLSADGGATALHTGNLFMSMGATFKLAIPGGISGLGQISATGSVSLNGANLAAVVGLAPFSGIYTIIDNDGTDVVAGTFANLGEGAIFSAGGNNYQISYQGGTGNDVTLTLTNAAPVLTSGTATLADITEDAIANNGQLVSDFRNAITDPDNTPEFGIAVTSASTTGGHWEYQSNGAGPWIDFGTVSTTQALLLRDTDRVRFVPDQANGTSASFTYRAWDKSAGTAGGTADTTRTGDTTAFSTVENSVSLTVTSLNDAPSQAANLGLTVAEGSVTVLPATRLSFVDVDTGAPSPVYTITGAPARGTLFKGMTELGVNGTFTQQDIADGNISYRHNGSEQASDTFTFSVSDGVATVTGQTFKLTVTPVNDAPTLANSIPNQSSPEDTAWTFQVPPGTFNDVDSLSLTYTATLGDGTPLPAWLTFDGASQTFTGTPPQDVNGPIDLKVIASDGSLSTSAGFRLTLTATNDAPIVAHAIANQSSPEDTTWTFQVPLDTFSDVDGDTLGYTATLGDGSALPSWLNFDGATRTFSGKPPQDASFTISVKVTANDNTTSASSIFLLTVTPVNDTPVVALPIANQTVTEDAAWRFAVPAGTFTDVDSGTLIYTATLSDGTALPTWLSFDTASQTFAGTPPQDFNGFIDLKVTASDGSLNAAAGFRLTVTPQNDPPVVVHAIANQSSLEDATWTFQLPANTFNDVDGDALGYTATLADGSALPMWLSFDGATRTFSGKPPQDAHFVISLKVTANDGPTNVSSIFSLTVTPVNDAPVVLQPIVDQASPEDTAWTFQVPAGAFFDVDGDVLTYTAARADGTALPTWLNFDGATRTFSGTPPQDFNGAISVRVTANDGAVSTSDTFQLSVTPINDMPVVSAAAKLPSILVNSGANLITQSQLLATTTDVDGPSLAAVNLQIAKGLGTLTDNRDGTWTYTPTINDDTSVNFAYQVTDGTLSVNTDATLDILSAQSAPEIGSPFNDTFVAVTGNSAYQGGSGTDTISFNFKLTDATVTYSGNQVTIDGPTSHTVLTGLEIFQFTDGTVNNRDGSPLIDDLYYYSRNHDIWNAQVDADAHYNSFGWKEGRDPSAFFNTSLYLTLNPDVKASGQNPLTHYDTEGWKNGLTPSLTFDAAAYLATNTDVAAARLDPLAHFLSVGAEEGRQAAAVTELLVANGFDYAYYLKTNPDVAAAGIDPLLHFQTLGWKEGRNPNALFDTKGYLAVYSDVKGAGINPLDHYHSYGWQEGRDPSPNFDTTSYLAANPDVTAAGIDPLMHYLDYGRHEGRSAWADGMWG